MCFELEDQIFLFCYYFKKNQTESLSFYLKGYFPPIECCQNILKCCVFLSLHTPVGLIKSHEKRGLYKENVIKQPSNVAFLERNGSCRKQDLRIDGASGVPILEVCPFLDKIQVIESIESRAAVYIRRGFSVGVSGYGKEAIFSAQNNGNSCQLKTVGSVFCI